MKKRYVFTIGSLFIVGQSVFSYQSIIQISTLHKKLYQVQAKKIYGTTYSDIYNSSVEYVTYKYKKKQKDFRDIEKKVALIKKGKSLPNRGYTSDSEFSKIVKILSGQLLIGTHSLREEKNEKE